MNAFIALLLFAPTITLWIILTVDIYQTWIVD